jgi:hypothetical protein
VDDQVEILLGVVFRNLGESEFLDFSHGEGICEELTGVVSRTARTKLKRGVC